MTLKQGSTWLRVEDANNQFNFDSISVEVVPVNHVVWLEHRLELESQSGIAVLSPIALDQKGRKFTNCTALNMLYELKGESATLMQEPHSTWSEI